MSDSGGYYFDHGPDRRGQAPGQLPLHEGQYQYYPRFFPTWSWNSSTGTAGGAASNMAYSGDGQFYVIGEDGKRIDQVPPISGPMYDNAAYLGYRSKSGGGSYKLKPASEMTDSTDYFSQQASKRRCCVITAIVGLFFLVAAGIAIGIYFGVVDKPDSKKVTGTTAAPPTVVAFDVTVTRDVPYNANLNNPYSSDYQTLKTAVETEINTAFANSDQSTVYNGITVTGFSPGSTIVYLRVEYRATQYAVGNQMLTVNDVSVTQNAKAGLRRSGSTFFDVDSLVASQTSATGTADLGEGCSNSADCQDSGSNCTGSPTVCKCLPDFYDVNEEVLGGTCLAKLAYGVTCLRTTQCKTIDAECSNSQCLCPSSKYYDGISLCLDKIQFGGTGCTESPQCVTPNAVCGLDGICTCGSTDFLSAQQSCTPKIGINQTSCRVDSECSTLNSVCSSAICRCTPATYYNEAANECKTKLNNGESCVSQSQCAVDNAVCDVTCKCDNTKYETNGACVNKKVNGGSCLNATQCLFTGAGCITNVCACPTTTYEDGNACIDKKAYDDSCVTVSQCSTTESICDNSKCTCASTKYFNTPSNTCINKKGNGETCSVVSQCLVTKAICDQTQQNTCQCPSDHYLSGTDCWPKKANGESCAAGPEECAYTNSDCIGNVCKCPSDRFEEGTVCEQKVANGEGCAGEDNRCVYSGAVCDPGNSTCVCPQSYYTQDIARECKPKLQNGEACQTTTQCSFASAKCIQSTCACEDDKYEVIADKQCLPKKPIGEDCEDVDQCEFSLAECQNTCNCPAAYFVDGSSCTKKKDIGIGCTAANQCVVTGAVCIETCQCPTTSVLIDGDCKPKVDYQGTCDVTEECSTENAQCLSSKCACPNKYFLDVDKCSEQLGNGQACGSPTECVYTNATCSSGQCTCPSDRYADDQQEACIMKKNNGDACSEDIQCKLADAQCTSQLCNCPTNTYNNGQACLEQVANGLACSSTQECKTENAVCDGTCSCVDGDYLNDTICVAKVANGGSCTTSAACLINGAQCINNQCNCVSTQFEDGDQCTDKKEYGALCGDVNECSFTGAVCSVTCTCISSEYFDDIMCQPKIVYNDPCSGSDLQCLTTKGKCLDSVCKCSENYYHNTTEDTCSLKVFIGRECEDTVQCVTENAFCNNNLCGCPSSRYLGTTSCLLKKENGVACTGDIECKVTNATCDGTCDCSEDTYLRVDVCVSKKNNGMVCGNTFECGYTNSVCLGGVCGCDTDMYESGTSCLQKKVYGEACLEDKECVAAVGGCVNLYCGCTDGQYYTGTECLPLVIYNGTCTSHEVCSTKDAACIDGSCLCQTDRFLSGNECLQKIGAGQSCSGDGQCSLSGSVCLSGQCTCPSDHYLNTAQTLCLQKKDEGETCESSIECLVEDSVCNSTSQCGCSDNKFNNGTHCLPQKVNGSPCNNVMECLALNAVCDQNVCTCSSADYLNGDQCTQRLVFGEGCGASTDCMAEFVCIDSTCQCEQGKFYNGSVCEIVTTTTPLPTTAAPDEIITVDVGNEMVLDTTFNEDLTNTSSDAFKETAQQFEDTIMESLNDSLVQAVNVTSFSPGSTNVAFTISVTLDIVIQNKEDPAATVNIDNLVLQITTEAVQENLDTIKMKIAKTDSFKGAAVIKTKVKEVKKEQCKDTKVYLDRVNSPVCQAVYNYFLQLGPDQAYCSAYLHLLDCVFNNLDLDGINCEPNAGRTFFKIALHTELDIDTNTIKDLGCIPGNLYHFKPFVIPDKARTKCNDFGNMKTVMQFACPSEYQSVTRIGEDPCGATKSLEVCSRDFVYSDISACIPEDRKTRLQAIVDYSNFFFDKRMGLEACPFCIAPNVMYFLQTYCGYALPSLAGTADLILACQTLHKEMLCVEAHTLMFQGEICTMTELKELLKHDDVYQGLPEEVKEVPRVIFESCIDSEIMRIGNPKPTNHCENQNYINYTLQFSPRCDTEVEVPADLKCSMLLPRLECVVATFKEEGKVDCDFEELLYRIFGKLADEQNAINIKDVLPQEYAVCADNYDVAKQTLEGRCHLWSFRALYEASRQVREAIPMEGQGGYAFGTLMANEEMKCTVLFTMIEIVEKIVAETFDEDQCPMVPLQTAGNVLMRAFGILDEDLECSFDDMDEYCSSPTRQFLHSVNTCGEEMLGAGMDSSEEGDNTECRKFAMYKNCIERKMDRCDGHSFLRNPTVVEILQQQFGFSLECMGLTEEICLPYAMEWSAENLCSNYWKAYNQPDYECRKLEYFIGCLQFNALFYKQECDVRGLVNSVLQYATKKTGQEAHICDPTGTDRIAELIELLPVSIQDRCTKPFVIAAITTTECVLYQLSSFTDKEKCSEELSLRGCAKDKLNTDMPNRCTNEQIEAGLNVREFREAAGLPITNEQCEQEHGFSLCYVDTLSLMRKYADCFRDAATLVQLAITGRVNPNDYTSANEDLSLVCSRFQAGTNCFFAKANPCNIRETGNKDRETVLIALIDELHRYGKGSISLIQSGDNPVNELPNFDQCKENLEFTAYDGECPDSRALLEYSLPICLNAMESSSGSSTYSRVEKCDFYETCLKDPVKSRYPTTCFDEVGAEDRIAKALQEHPAFFTSITELPEDLCIWKTRPGECPPNQVACSGDEKPCGNDIDCEEREKCCDVCESRGLCVNAVPEEGAPNFNISVTMPELFDSDLRNSSSDAFKSKQNYVEEQITAALAYGDIFPALWKIQIYSFMNGSIEALGEMEMLSENVYGVDVNATTVQQEINKGLEDIAPFQFVLSRTTAIRLSDDICLQHNIGRSTENQCRLYFENYNKNSNCRYLEYLIGCLQYNALARGQECDVRSLAQYVTDFVVRKTKKQASICPPSVDGADRIAELIELLPVSIQDRCTKPYVIVAITTTECVLYQLSSFTDKEKCSVEVSLRACAKNKLNAHMPNQCTDEHIEAGLNVREFREAVELPITDDPCEKEFSEFTDCYMDAIQTMTQNEEAAACFIDSLSLVGIAMYGMEDVNLLRSADDDQKSLVCSRMESGLGCFVAKGNPCELSTGSNEQLRDDVVSAVSDSLSLYAKVVSTNEFSDEIISELELPSFTECKDGYVWKPNNDAPCPSYEDAIENILPTCYMGLKLHGQQLQGRNLTQYEKCMGYEACFNSTFMSRYHDCFERQENIPEFMEEAINEYTEFYQDLTGLEPNTCSSGLQECFNKVGETTHCSTGFSILFGFRERITLVEFCKILKPFYNHAKKCVKNSIDSEICTEAQIEMAVEAYNEYTNMTTRLNECNDYSSDECEVAEQIAVLGCVTELEGGNCKFWDCVMKTHTELECNTPFSMEDARSFTQQLFSGYVPDKCEGCAGLVEGHKDRVILCFNISLQVLKAGSPENIWVNDERYNLLCNTYDLGIRCVKEDIGDMLNSPNMQCDMKTEIHPEIIVTLTEILEDKGMGYIDLSELNTCSETSDFNEKFECPNKEEMRDYIMSSCQYPVQIAMDEDKCKAVARCTDSAYQTVTDIYRENCNMLDDVFNDVKNSEMLEDYFTQIIDFNPGHCDGDGEDPDINPCMDEFSLNDAVDGCYPLIEGTMPTTVVDFCTLVYEIEGCVDLTLSMAGRINCYSYQMTERIYRRLQYKYEFPPFSSSLNETCYGKRAVCQPRGIRDAVYNHCMHDYYGWMTGFGMQPLKCSNETDRKAAAEVLLCIRVVALSSGEEQCTGQEIKSTIGKDGNNLWLFSSIEDCLPDAMVQDLDTQLPNKDSVCSSGKAISFFSKQCNSSCIGRNMSSSELSKNITCLLHFTGVQCVQDHLKARHFECSFTQLTDEQMDTYLPTLLNQTQKNYCNGPKFGQSGDFSSCTYPLIRSMNTSRGCYEHLFDMSRELPENRKCGLFYSTKKCWSNTFDGEAFGCNQSFIDAQIDALGPALLDMIDITRHTRSCFNTSRASNFSAMFSTCPDMVPDDFDLCSVNDGFSIDLLLDVINTSCYRQVWSLAQSYVNHADLEIIDPSLVGCILLDTYSECGVNSTEKLHQKCSKGHVRQTLMDNEEYISSHALFKDFQLNLDHCVDSCHSNIRDVMHACSDWRLVNQVIYSEDCRSFGYIYSCMRSSELLSECETATIENYLKMALLAIHNQHGSYYMHEHGWLKCDATYVDMCEEQGMSDLVVLGWSYCNPYQVQMYGCRAMPHLSECLSSLVDKYGVDCQPDKKSITYGAIMILGAKMSHNFRPCLPDRKADSYCPIGPFKGHYQHACDVDSVDECYIDSSCESDQICCSNGCNLACTPPSDTPATYDLNFLIMTEEWKEEYKNEDDPATDELVERIQPRIDTLVQSLEAKSFELKNIKSTLYNDKLEVTLRLTSFIDLTQNSLDQIAEDFPDFLFIAIHYVPEPREGECPWFISYLDYNGNTDYCMNDQSCMYPKKCCANPDGTTSFCVDPLFLELFPACDDQTELESAATECDVDLFNAHLYSCSVFLMGMDCMVSYQNHKRKFTEECTITQLFNSLGNDERYSFVNNPDNLKCQAYEVTLEWPNVDDNPQFCEESKEQAANAISIIEDSGSMLVRGIVDDDCNPPEGLTLVIAVDSPDIQGLDNLFPSNVNVVFYELSQDKCTDMNTLKAVASQCVHMYKYYHYQHWETCKLLTSFTQCMAEMIENHFDDRCNGRIRVFRDKIKKANLINHLKQIPDELSHPFIDQLEHATCDRIMMPVKFRTTGVEFSDELFDDASVEFGNLKNIIETEISDAMKNSVLSIIFVSFEVSSFGPGSVVVYGNLTVNDTEFFVNGEMMDYDEGVLVDILRNSLPTPYDGLSIVVGHDVEEPGPENACEHEAYLKRAVKYCMETEMGDKQPEISYGIEGCRAFYDILDCVDQYFSRLGAKCYYDYGLQQRVYDNLAEMYALPYTSIYSCYDYLPICTGRGIRNIIDVICYTDYLRYRTNMMHNPLECRNDTDRKAVSDVLVCVRMAALDRGEKDCTGTEIKKTVANFDDYLSLVVSLDECIEDDIIEEIDAELPSLESVCTSPSAIGLFGDTWCTSPVLQQGGCIDNIQNSNINGLCSYLINRSNCLSKSISEGFIHSHLYCEPRDILETSLVLLDTEERKDMCRDKVEDMDPCVTPGHRQTDLSMCLQPMMEGGSGPLICSALQSTVSCLKMFLPYCPEDKLSSLAVDMLDMYLVEPMCFDGVVYMNPFPGCEENKRPGMCPKEYMCLGTETNCTTGADCQTGQRCCHSVCDRPVCLAAIPEDGAPRMLVYLTRPGEFNVNLIDETSPDFIEAKTSTETNVTMALATTDLDRVLYRAVVTKFSPGSTVTVVLLELLSDTVPKQDSKITEEVMIGNLMAGLQAVANNVYLLDEIRIEQLQEPICGPEPTNATWSACGAIWKKFEASHYSDCRHFDNLALCIAYNARNNVEECALANVVMQLQEWVERSYTSHVASGLSPDECNPSVDDLAALLPGPSERCESSRMAEILLEYVCGDLDVSMANATQQCVIEKVVSGCMLNEFNKARSDHTCTMADIQTLMINNDVRSIKFNQTVQYCAGVLPASPCYLEALESFHSNMTHIEICFMPLNGLLHQYYIGENTPDKASVIMPEKTVKCSAFERVVSCVWSKQNICLEDDTRISAIFNASRDYANIRMMYAAKGFRMDHDDSGSDSYDSSDWSSYDSSGWSSYDSSDWSSYGSSGWSSSDSSSWSSYDSSDWSSYDSSGWSSSDSSSWSSSDSSDWSSSDSSDWSSSDSSSWSSSDSSSWSSSDSSSWSSSDSSSWSSSDSSSWSSSDSSDWSSSDSSSWSSSDSSDWSSSDSSDWSSSDSSSWSSSDSSSWSSSDSSSWSSSDSSSWSSSDSSSWSSSDSSDWSSSDSSSWSSSDSSDWSSSDSSDWSSSDSSGWGSTDTIKPIDFNDCDKPSEILEDYDPFCQPETAVVETVMTTCEPHVRREKLTSLIHKCYGYEGCINYTVANMMSNCGVTDAAQFVFSALSKSTYSEFLQQFEDKIDFQNCLGIRQCVEGLEHYASECMHRLGMTQVYQYSLSLEQRCSALAIFEDEAQMCSVSRVAECTQPMIKDYIRIVVGAHNFLECEEMQVDVCEGIAAPAVLSCTEEMPDPCQFWTCVEGVHNKVDCVVDMRFNDRVRDLLQQLFFISDYPDKPAECTGAVKVPVKLRNTMDEFSELLSDPTTADYWQTKERIENEIDVAIGQSPISPIYGGSEVLAFESGSLVVYLTITLTGTTFEENGLEKDLQDEGALGIILSNSLPTYYDRDNIIVGSDALPPGTSSPGSCPVEDGSDSVGICLQECDINANCSGESRCCFNGCGHVCEMEGETYQRCLTDEESFQTDVRKCSEDKDCYDKQKCCSNVCTESERSCHEVEYWMDKLSLTITDMANSSIQCRELEEAMTLIMGKMEYYDLEFVGFCIGQNTFDDASLLDECQNLPGPAIPTESPQDTDRPGPTDGPTDTARPGSGQEATATTSSPPRQNTTTTTQRP